MIAGLALATAVPVLLPLCWSALCRLTRPADHLIARTSGRLAGSGTGSEPDAGTADRRAQRRASVSHLAGTVEVHLGARRAVFLVTDLGLIVAPLNATHVLGVLATAVIAIGSLATLLGTLAFLVQTRKPLSVFRFLRLNVTPVLTIIVIIAVVGGVLDKNSSLHQVSGPVAARRSAASFAGRRADYLAAQPAHDGVRGADTGGGYRGRPSGADPAAGSGRRLRRRHQGGLVDRPRARHSRGHAVRQARRLRGEQRQRRLGGRGSARRRCPGDRPARSRQPRPASRRSRTRTRWRPGSTVSCCGTRSRATPGSTSGPPDAGHGALP